MRYPEKLPKPQLTGNDLAVATFREPPRSFICPRPDRLGPGPARLRWGAKLGDVSATAEANAALFDTQREHAPKGFA